MRKTNKQQVPSGFEINVVNPRVNGGLTEKNVKDYTKIDSANRVTIYPVFSYMVWVGRTEAMEPAR